jgi:tetratricopeptide (TPR) repeat protein
LAVDANRASALLLAETESRPAALAHLRQACDGFPHHYGLCQLYIEWLREDGPAAVEPVVRQLIAIHSADASARRELALSLSNQGRHDEAFAELEIASHLEPAQSAYFTVRAQVCANAGRLAEAQDAYRDAIHLSVDNDFAISRLLELCHNLAERRAALALVETEFERQVVFGDGLLAYVQHAQATLEPEELLACLRRALDARPDLCHAWSAVVRQLSNMQCHAEALELARKATARFPLLPQLWFDLANVLRANKDSVGELEAIQRALQISPGWGDALRRLSEIHDRQGRLDKAKEVLKQAVARAPLDCYNHGCLADVLWRSAERERAVECVKRAIQLEPGYDWGWNALCRWSLELERPQLALDCARDLTKRRPGEARSWMILARVLAQAEDQTERLDAFERALTLNPRLSEASDLKAEQLAAAGRFDEALAACQPSAWGEKMPVSLRGRAAWIEAKRGQIARAIELMRAVLTEDANYYWGWYHLAEWCRDHASNDEYLAASDQMVRLGPRSAQAFGYRGEARLRGGDRPGAHEDFRLAMEIDPDYAFAGMSLFDEQLADNELEAAARTLAVLAKHVGGDYVTAREVQWCAQKRERQPALEGLRKLCLSSSTDTWPLDAATEAMRQGSWQAQALEIMQEALYEDRVHPHVGALWVNYCTSQGDWSCPRRFDRLLAKGEVGRRALFAYLEALAKARRSFRLHRCVKRYKNRLREDTIGWGNVGYAYVTVNGYRRTAGWLSDWAQRKDAQPWMLLNLVLALQALGRHQEATTVSLHAATLPGDHCSKYHHLWLAFEAAVAGQTQQALEGLGRIDSASPNNVHGFVAVLTEVLVAVQGADDTGRRTAFAKARRELRQATKSHPSLTGDCRIQNRAYKRCVKRLTIDCRSFWGRIWCRWQRMNSLAPHRT